MIRRTDTRRLPLIVAALLGLVLIACQATHDDVITFDKDVTIDENEQVKRLLSNGDSYLKSELYDEAEKAYREVLRLDEENRTAYKNLAFALRKQNKAEDAYSMNQRYTIKFPDDPDGWATLAAACAEREDWPGAVRNTTKAVELKPDDVSLHTDLGYYQTQTEDLDGAIASYEKVQELEPENEKIEKLLTQLYQKTGRTDDLLASLDEQIEKDPENATLLNKAAKQYRDQEDFATAAGYYEQIAAIEPENAGVQRNIGLCYMQIPDSANALVAFERAVEIDPGSAKDLVQLAELQSASRVGRYSDATANLQKAIALEKDNARAYCSWGKILERREQYEQAIVKFETAAGLEDAVWSQYAQLEITRQRQLIERREKLKEREEYEATEEAH